MLHMDVLLLIYRFAGFSPGNVLEIGPYVGGSTIAAAYDARESSVPKKIISIVFAAKRSIEKNPMMASTIVAQPKVICAIMDEIR